ncbi:MAG: DUF3598 family protein [Oscillatoriales cyanobacterium]|nr:MAG: DUF3598 family protein [Oscillatoriales cyanobacterium]
MRSTWNCLLENLGEWRGSFATVDEQGQVLSDDPSITSLESSDGGKTIHQRVRKFAPTADRYFPDPQTAPPTKDLNLTYSEVGRGFLALETGAFSQGSIQLAPFAEFGAELGLVARPYRSRLVIRYDRDRHLMPLTVIREGLHPEVPPGLGHTLTPAELLDQLSGQWAGESVTVYPDFQPASYGKSQLTMTRSGDQLLQTLEFGDQTLTSAATIRGDRLEFAAGKVTVLLLADGLSASFPSHLDFRRSLFLEAGWLIEPNLRQRLIRRYSDRGEWVALTLVTERRLAQ